jgi:hypothetical protein
MTVLQGGAEALGFCVSWGNRASGATCRVAGYSFPLLSGESGVLAFWCGNKGSLAVRDSGEAGPLCSVEREASWCQKITKLGA